MTRYKFHLAHEDSLVLVDCRIHTGTFTLALDTGASHTIIDLTALLMIGVNLTDKLRTVSFETANGEVEASVYLIPSFRALGHTVRDFEICAYDFLANGIVSDFDGMMGLDFLKGKDLILSFRRFEISLI